jgi:microcystin-dependent protein
MHSLAIGSAGNGQAHDNMMPFLAISFIICLEGFYPTQS